MLTEISLGYYKTIEVGIYLRKLAEEYIVAWPVIYGMIGERSF